jgi:hypothetical protein
MIDHGDIFFLLLIWPGPTSSPLPCVAYTTFWTHSLKVLSDGHDESPKSAVQHPFCGSFSPTSTPSNSNTYPWAVWEKDSEFQWFFQYKFFWVLRRDVNWHMSQWIELWWKETDGWSSSEDTAGAGAWLQNMPVHPWSVDSQSCSGRCWQPYTGGLCPQMVFRSYVSK